MLMDVARIHLDHCTVHSNKGPGGILTRCMKCVDLSTYTQRHRATLSWLLLSTTALRLCWS